MINSSKNQIIYKINGEELDRAIRTSLNDASIAWRNARNLSDFDLNSVTTHTNHELGFSKFVECHILLKKNMTFDKAYIENAFAFCKNYEANSLREKQFEKFALSESFSKFEFRKMYVGCMRNGAGIFLLRLHSLGAIVLPSGFDWPVKRERKSVVGNFSSEICCELLSFIRSLDPLNFSNVDPAIKAVIDDRKSAEYFSTFGTKLLLATGWQTANDIDLDELLLLKESMVVEQQSKDHYPFSKLVEALARKFGATCNFTLSDWKNKINKSEILRFEESKSRYIRVRNSATGKLNTGRTTQIDIATLSDFSREEITLLAESLAHTPTSWAPARLGEKSNLAGHDIELNKISSDWEHVQNIFINRYEFNCKPMNEAIGYFNIYLFNYLPCWFKDNRAVNLRYPSEPNKLTPGIFVSRFAKIDSCVPLTYIEFIKLFQQARNWSNTYLRIVLKNLEKFFEWVARHSDMLQGCAGFKMPFSPSDFPVVPGRRGTNKMPIPLELFGWMLDYAEMLLALTNRIIDLVLNEGINIRLLQRNAYRRIGGKLVIDYIGNAGTKFKKGPLCFVGNIINVRQLSDLIGFTPVIIRDGKTIFPDVIPNILEWSRVDIKGRGVVAMPHPHSLIHIIVAMYTGLRSNHIQWLDLNLFDIHAVARKSLVTHLYVSTDKMGNIFQPVVNWRVIELLREQKAWRSRIDSDGFKTKLYYNMDEKVHYEKIMPLFSLYPDGQPHSDGRYQEMFSTLLMSMVGMLNEFGITQCSNIIKLAVPGVNINDDEATWWAKSIEHSDNIIDDVKNSNKYSKLIAQSDITVHSCRVTVVRDYLTILTPEVIGRDITGQAPVTIGYYANHPGARTDILDENNALVQAVANKGRRVINIVRAVDGPSPALDVCGVESPLIRSLRENLPAALSDFGCTSLSPDANARNGLDVLVELGIMHAAFNDTEICPYGNRCPSEVLIAIGDAKRCGICKFAVRSIDHLPAIESKQRIFTLDLSVLAEKIRLAKLRGSRFSQSDIQKMSSEANYISQEIVGYKLASEALNERLIAIREGRDTRKWVVQQPEIIIKNLQRVEEPSDDVLFTLALLEDAVTYPGMETPAVAARVSKFSRRVKANLEVFVGYITQLEPIDDIEACTGLLRSIVAAKGLTPSQVNDVLVGDGYIGRSPVQHALALQELV